MYLSSLHFIETKVHLVTHEANTHAGLKGKPELLISSERHDHALDLGLWAREILAHPSHVTLHLA